MASNSANVRPVIDIHICGLCRDEFHSIETFIDHKRVGCVNKTESTQTDTQPVKTRESTPDVVTDQAEVQSPADDHISVVSSVDVTEPSNTIVTCVADQANIIRTVTVVEPSNTLQTIPAISETSQTRPMQNIIVTEAPREPPDTPTIDVSGLDLTCTQTSQPIQMVQTSHAEAGQTTAPSTIEVMVPQSSISIVVPTTTAVQAAAPPVVTHDEHGAPLSPSKFQGVMWTPRLSRRYDCDVDGCAFTTQYQRDLERHKRVHTGERPFTCMLCNKSFTRNDKLKIHMRAHTGSKPYKCSQCDYAAADSSSLRKHLRVHTGERPFKCQICPYASRNSSQLIVHLRTHTGDSPFQCQICSAKFKINSDLKRHMRMHTGEKPYKCDFCDYRCSIKGNLKSHMKINHNNSNEFKCDICSQSVPSRKILRNHRKMHGPPKPLECPIEGCIYQCHNRAALKNHMRIHSNEKPFKCEYCDYTSRQKGNVYTHIKKKHPDRYRFKKPIEREGVQLVSMPDHAEQQQQQHMQQQQQQQQPVIQTNIVDTQIAMATAQQEASQQARPTGKGKQQKIKALCKKCYKCEVCHAEFVRDDSLRSHMRQHREIIKTTSLEKTLENTALAVLQLSYPLPNALINAAVAEVIGTSAPATSSQNTIRSTQPPQIISQQVPVQPQIQHMQNNPPSLTFPTSIIQNFHHRNPISQSTQVSQSNYAPLLNSTAVQSTSYHLSASSQYNTGLAAQLPSIQNLGQIQQPTVVRAQDAHALLGFVQNNHNMSAEQNLQNSLVSTMATSTVPSHCSYTITHQPNQGEILRPSATAYHLTQSPSGVTLSQAIRGMQPQQQLQTVTQGQLGGINLGGRQDLLPGGQALGQMTHHNMQSSIPHPGYPRGIQLTHVQGNTNEERM